jgi:hypothetical protein
MQHVEHISQSASNSHQAHSDHATRTDPALTYLPGYGEVVSPIPGGPMQLRLQDNPATEPGDGTKYMTIYTLNKQYSFSKAQSVRAAVPANSVALRCADIPKLIQMYRYFTVPTLSDVVARHRLQTSTRISSLTSIIAEHQCDSTCPGYNDVFATRNCFRKILREEWAGLHSFAFSLSCLGWAKSLREPEDRGGIKRGSGRAVNLPGSVAGDSGRV